MALISPSPKLQFIDSNGNPISGGKVYTYAAGTTTPVTTYTSYDGLTANTNPIILDSAGRCSIWLDDEVEYKFVVKDANDVLLFTTDNINTPPSQWALLQTSSGSSYVGFIAAGSGAVATTVQAKLRRFMDVKDFGAVGDGITDDTTAIQAAMTAATGQALYFPRGTYITRQLVVPSNSHFIFDPQTILKAKTGYTANEVLLAITAVSNVVIDGNNATIQMIKSEYTSGEQRHGIRIVSSSNVTINDLRVIDTGGDGFYLGTSDVVTPSRRITLNSCRTYNTRRNGLSIVSATDVWVNGGDYSFSNGTAPEWGIDIEPNLSTDYMENININGVSLRDNAVAGIGVVFSGLGLTASRNVSVNISDIYVENAGIGGGLRIANGPVNKLYGQVVFNNAVVVNPSRNGVLFSNSNNNIPQVTFRNITVINPGNAAASTTPIFTSAVSLYTGYDSGSYTASGPSNVTFEDCRFVDNRVTKKMFAGVYMTTTGTRYYQNILFKDVEIIDYTNNQYVFGSTSTNNANINVIKTSPKILTRGTTSLIERYIAGDILTCSTTSNMTLSSSSIFPGMEFEFKVTTVGVSMVIAIQPTDTIFFNSLAVGSSLILDYGSRVRLRAVTGGWEIVDSSIQYRTNAGTPVAALVPRWIGQMAYDSTNKEFYIATGLTAADWQIIT